MVLLRFVKVLWGLFPLVKPSLGRMVRYKIVTGWAYRFKPALLA